MGRDEVPSPCGCFNGARTIPMAVRGKLRMKLMIHATAYQLPSLESPPPPSATTTEITTINRLAMRGNRTPHIEALSSVEARDIWWGTNQNRHVYGMSKAGANPKYMITTAAMAWPPPPFTTDTITSIGMITVSKNRTVRAAKYTKPLLIPDCLFQPYRLRALLRLRLVFRFHMA